MTGRFQPRPIHPVGVGELNGWQLNRYEITLDGARLPDALHEAVDAQLAAELPRPPGGELGVGFVIVHRGAEQVWLLADLWTNDHLNQHTFYAPLDGPLTFTRVPAGGPTACVFELPVHAHERDAFVRHVLDPPGGPAAAAYLADTVTSDLISRL